MYKVEEEGLDIVEARRALLHLLNRKCGTAFQTWKEANDDLDLELWSLNATVSLYSKRCACFELDGVVYDMEKY